MNVGIFHLIDELRKSIYPCSRSNALQFVIFALIWSDPAGRGLFEALSDLFQDPSTIFGDLCNIFGASAIREISIYNSSSSRLFTSFVLDNFLTNAK